ncbi:MAG: transcription termination/antitermination protein NusG [Gemmataceae bacterium]
MPFLPPEPDLYPSTLLDESSSALATPPGSQWWLVRTKPRQEKALARRLFERGLTFFAPTAPKRNIIRGRVFHSQVPLFPGYAFARTQGAERADLLRTNCVIQLLDVPDVPTLLQNLRQVRCVLSTGRPVFPEEQIAPGNMVRIVAGPLAGLEGVVVQQGEARKFIVRVELLQRGVGIELDEQWLARVLSPVGAAQPLAREPSWAG